MPFGYYDRLSPARQRIYRKSDDIRRIEMPDVAALIPLAIAIEPALEEMDAGREVARVTREGRYRTPSRRLFDTL